MTIIPLYKYLNVEILLIRFKLVCYGDNVREGLKIHPNHRRPFGSQLCQQGTYSQQSRNEKGRRERESEGSGVNFETSLFSSIQSVLTGLRFRVT